MYSMRKLIVLIMLVIVVFPVVCVAEDVYTREEYYKQVEENTKGLLQSVVDYYNQDPEQFDADMIFFAYTYLEEGIMLQRISLLEKMWKVVQNGYVMFNGMIRDQIKDSVMLKRLMDAKYEKWLNGEEGDADFAKYVIAMINTMILTEYSAPEV